MELKTLKQTFEENQEKSLIFILPNHTELRRGFHLTEVKRASLATIDCGSKEHRWEETIIQLWSPEKGGERKMNGHKAKNILDKSHERLELLDTSSVVFELGESIRENLFPTKATVVGDEIRIHLAGLPTGCKALHRYDKATQWP